MRTADPHGAAVNADTSPGRMLEGGHLRGAAMDVFDIEPLPPGHPFLAEPGILLSPHIGGSTEEALERTAVQVAGAVVDALEGRRPMHLVNPDVWTRRRQPVQNDLVDTAEAWTDPLESEERRQLVGRALAAVGRQDRRILVLTLVEGLKPGEIADRLGLKHDVVRTRKSRALRKLVERLRSLLQI